MTHARKQIRDAVKALVTGLTTTGARVYASRVYPLKDGNLPGLCVYTESESIAEDTGKLDQVQDRALSIVVEGYDKLISGLDDNLDTIAEEVETAIFADRFLSGLVNATDLESTEITFSDELEKPTGVIKMTFVFYYFTAEGAPGTAL